MLFYLLLLLVIVPLTELWLLVQISELISFPLTLALLIITGIAGAALARRQGWNNWQRIQSELERGEVPAASMIDGLFILIAGVLLILPGVLSDVIGLALLVPPVRALLRRRLTTRLKARTAVHFHNFAGQAAHPSRHDDNVIDAEFTRVPEERQKLPG